MLTCVKELLNTGEFNGPAGDTYRVYESVLRYRPTPTPVCLHWTNVYVSRVEAMDWACRLHQEYSAVLLPPSPLTSGCRAPACVAAPCRRSPRPAARSLARDPTVSPRTVTQQAHVVSSPRKQQELSVAIAKKADRTAHYVRYNCAPMPPNCRLDAVAAAVR